jgi:hypothetical protein
MSSFLPRAKCESSPSSKLSRNGIGRVNGDFLEAEFWTVAVNSGQVGSCDGRCLWLREGSASRPSATPTKAPPHFRTRHGEAMEKQKKERAGNFPALSIAAHAPRLLGPQDSGDCCLRRRLLRPHETGSGSAEVQSLLELLAGFVAENPRADHALGSALARRTTACRTCQIGVNFTLAGQTQASDLPAGIDGATS